MTTRRVWHLAPLFTLLTIALSFTLIQAQDEITPNPNSVTIAGTIQSILGCPGDWQPECETTALIYDETDNVWQGTFDLPAGDYEYKAALNGTWEENYGVDAQRDGANIALSLAEDTTVQFFYDHKTHWITDNINSQIVVAAGSFQSELSCPDDWQPDCLRSWLQDEDGNGLYSFKSTDIPAGSYEVKIAIGQSWDENYGEGGEPNGANIAFDVPTNGLQVTIGFSPRRKFINVGVRNPDEETAPVLLPTATPQATAGLTVTVPGSYQFEIGCPPDSGAEGDWAPDCNLSLATDDDGDGIYTFTTASIPAGNYEAKIAIDRSWSENYGLDGVRDGPNIPFEVPIDYAQVTFAFDSGTKVMTISVDESITGGPAVIDEAAASIPDLSQQRAHWVAADTIAWRLRSVPEDATFALFYSPTAGMVGDTSGFSSSEHIDLALDPDGLSEAILARFPHLQGYTTLKIGNSDIARVPDILKGQAGVVMFGSDGNALDGTGIQIPGVLDDLYSYDGVLGVSYEDDTPTLSVWAPTAQNVRLHLFDDSSPETEATTLDMTSNPETGVWSITGDAGWTYKYYLYEVTVYAPTTQRIETNLVTDPYSFSLSTNSARSQIVNLNDPALMPDGWGEIAKPTLEAPEDIVIYELHVRDFSINDMSVPEDLRGTFKAFTLTESNGMQHLIGLAQAGLTHLHLLPAFDIATINENKAERIEPDWATLATFAPDSEEQQAAIVPIRDQDGFNWGYDPLHYTVPEGSYSTDPDGPARILEFREMVQSLNTNGLRVVMDVVYNHTNASGQAAKSVLDRIVPGYYHRLNDRGGVETSTCCQNTATEHDMMEKLMIDSVLTWATAYKVDGFRFDLMGHHMRANMENLRAALDALTVENSGVDGQSIYVYGEGWNFGEVADNARGVNATQMNMGGVGIGTFNDRLRDAVRGGSPFGDRAFQGFITDLALSPNGLTGGTPEEQMARLLLFGDQIRVGLAGNLRDYSFTDASGGTVTGADILYNGSPAGYTLDPQEHIVYISKHDNETLWDIILYKQLPDVTASELARMHNLGVSIVLFSQGVPFFQAGDDLLRSKSLDRNSYNSGDWFNRLDFTYQTNNFGVGLPPSTDNQDRWEEMRPILANTALMPTGADIAAAMSHFREMLQVRQSSRLFRLTTAEDIQARLTFQNTGPDQLPGVIVMTLSDMVQGEDLDPNNEMIVVIFNARSEEVEYSYEGAAGMAFELHPVLAASADVITASAGFDSESGTFHVPGRTAAVFVIRQT